MLDNILGKTRRFVPRSLFDYMNPVYHWTLALSAAIWHRFPSRHIKVIAVTGTKGKSSTTEILNAILEEAGHKTAVSNTIRFKIADHSEPNIYKMSMPGRGFMQRFLREAVNAGCTHAVIEMTSQGALLYRHSFIDIDTFIFTNISPEHIEAHGSYEKYRDAKLSIARSLAHSSKKPTTIIVNADDKEHQLFLDCFAQQKIKYALEEFAPYEVKNNGITFTLAGKTVHSPLSGLFNLYNILAAVSVAKNENILDAVIVRAIEKFSSIPGRVQKILSPAGFEIVIDYAHTPDSLEKFYQVFRKTTATSDSRTGPEASRRTGPRNICILGGTGGGRDIWKREEMGRIADTYCHEIILTDEDPYDEDPRKIVDDVASGIKLQKPTIIMDRRLAIREAISRAKAGDSILITGKGTDPYIMGPHGTKTPWSDAEVAEEELGKLI